MKNHYLSILSDDLQAFVIDIEREAGIDIRVTVDDSRTGRHPGEPDPLRLWEQALGSDHGNQQLIQHNDSVWTPYVILRAPLLGVKTAL